MLFRSNPACIRLRRASYSAKACGPSRIGVLHLGHLLETGTTEEIFADPIHPYTRSLLSAIPLPNPVVEKRRVAETYDYASSGIDYSKGTSHLVSGSHYVKCTDEEFAKWCK